MPNQTILITGCQRSGTTMLNLAFDSHPGIRGIDEEEYRDGEVHKYLNDAAYGPWVCFKMPTWAADIQRFQQFPGIKVIWCLRDPRQVVASMIKLQLSEQGLLTSWAAHPYGAVGQIKGCLNLFRAVPPEIAQDVAAFGNDLRTAPTLWNTTQLTRSAALCWRLKNEVPRVYEFKGIAYKTAIYERLVTEPRVAIGELLAFVGAPWHDDVLSHHQFKRGMAVGRTDMGRAIDTASLEKWRSQLDPEQVALVTRICGPRAKELGYDL